MAQDAHGHRLERGGKRSEPLVEIVATVVLDHRRCVPGIHAEPPVEIRGGRNASLRHINLVEARDKVVELAKDPRGDGNLRLVTDVTNGDFGTYYHWKRRECGDVSRQFFNRP